ncbi:phosphoribosylamine--glycine ligase [Faunimonas pinastri]|uniref:Phosphoribosylamine--glycine ligase n=1 Tax=Faunimonas pinastri TaxID=1855383 RepID=A0A1H9N9V2_9HYPH|nr:phosphoribosylamine--glycine ligase [Faunimonas pinastri]SER32591.1 phosphoribosylamine--glycine ligase [Faunimonas pinastri]
MQSEGLTVLIIGGGAREHALYRAFGSSSRVARVLCAPGNGGIPAADRRAVGDSDGPALLNLAQREGVDLVVVGPEAPLVAGVSDVFTGAGIRVFGPSAAAAQLEGSKAFAKEICVSLGVPTADHVVASSYDEAEAAIRAFGSPVVVKADGLCAGKGVTVASSEQEALEAAGSMLSDKIFGEAGDTVVIERCLSGRECSVMAICDGENAILLPAVRDHKRALDGDRGPNTGGMGAYSPLPDVDQALLEKVKAEIILPVIHEMARRGMPYHGVLYAGLMLTESGPQVIEFNCRFGDPETQIALALLRTDIVDLTLAAIVPGGLANLPATEISDEAAVCVVLASGGYPGKYATGIPISGVDAADEGAFVFHAGTRDEGELVTSGGRVLNVVGVGATHEDARAKAYTACEKIYFEGMQFRRDIAAKLA